VNRLSREIISRLAMAVLGVLSLAAGVVLLGLDGLTRQHADIHDPIGELAIGLLAIGVFSLVMCFVRSVDTNR
jgi:hypothetical protein